MISPIGFTAIEHYLSALLKHHGTKRGFRSRLSEAIKCHRSHVSHLIAGTALLTLEQGDALALFLELDDFESDYLLELVQLSRAGTQGLRRRVTKRLLQIEKNKKQQMGGLEPEISPSDRFPAKRYSRCGMPQFNSPLQVGLASPQMRLASDLIYQLLHCRRLFKISKIQES